MKVRVLGASGSELPGHRLPAFLIDDIILLDAGTVGLALKSDDQFKIEHVLLTHAHLDHVRGLPFLIDNIAISGAAHAVTVISGQEVLRDLAENLFNGRIWPDFTVIPDGENPLLKLVEIQPDRPVTINGYRIWCQRMNHSVPTYGYVVEEPSGKALAYTGDTGPTEPFWEEVSNHSVVCLITEISFPNRLENLALKTGHLTPKLLEKEIGKIGRPPSEIWISHTKPQYIDEITADIRALGLKNIGIPEDDRVVIF